MAGAKTKFNQAIEKSAETSEYLKAYAHQQIQLQKLKLSKSIGKATAGIAEKIIIGVLFLMIFFFLLLATAFWLATVFNSYILAFLCIAGVLLLLFIIFLLTKKSLLQRPIYSQASKAVFNDELPKESEADLKLKIHRLELLLEESAKDIPETLQTLNAKDFLPEQVNAISNSFVVKSLRRVVNLFRKD